MNTPDLNAAAIIQRLEQVMDSLAAGIPIHHRWLDAAGIAALLSVSTRTVQERLATRPDFPVPLKIGHPRWKASEIMAWAEHQRHHHRARPRGKSGKSDQETAA